VELGKTSNGGLEPWGGKGERREKLWDSTKIDNIVLDENVLNGWYGKKQTGVKWQMRVLGIYGTTRFGKPGCRLTWICVPL